MKEVELCNYFECFNNNNFTNECLRENISLNFSGTCEYISTCDEYICSECDHYEVCDKPKKYLSENLEDEESL